MKKLCFVSILLLNFVAAVFAAGGDIENHPACTYCGMDRGKFAHSRVLIEYDDGTSFGACSLHCAALELATKIDKTPKTIAVGDYQTRTLIDAEKAVWVLGGKRAGVMTGNAKWAFAEKGAAAAFIKENGGTAVTFDEAMKVAYEDMYRDTKQIRERRKMRRSQMPKGGQ
ncbi:nitrous oxide reductase accessory protein NosL [Geomonas oryzisoli]|uniref:Nitrous oxide reductase accessory protein NosL n=1 Tax=Geomonas oryzisoli TaxID=2847992 RepID=A0ABX8J6K4_9BACT|nr:nitrous oxide reductase accessory protein NosL [Geomonas oryzisoli]QWV93948.1 nitrous oxide reductase accessory protein NosL [Geomonas oryzisoli]